MGAHGSDGSQLLPLAKPLLDTNGLLVGHEDINGEMSEVFLQGSSGSLDGDQAALNAHLDPIGYLHRLVGVEHLHL